MSEVSQNVITVFGSEYGDWYAIYVNDYIYYEGESIPRSIFLKIINEYRFFSKAESYEVPELIIEEFGGGFPSDKKEVMDRL